jgi:pimeloyl-ACP methyl ester carboxylesterase
MPVRWPTKRSRTRVQRLQVGVRRAAYLGHSLGGQLVMGYALTWPDCSSNLSRGGSRNILSGKD